MLDALGEAALRGLLLAGVVQGALWLLRIRQARLLLVTWTVVLVASIAMPVVPQFIPVHLPLDPARPGPLIEAATDLLPLSLPLGRVNGGAPVVVQAAPAAWPWAATIYLIVSCAILSRVLLGLGLAARILARAVPVSPEWAAGQRVRISRDVTGPVTIAHVILLPADAMAWPAGTRQAVLAHEQAHVARWDFAMLAVSQLNRALFWFSPLPWWLHRRLVSLSELTSDEQAIAATRDRLGYAEILLEMGRRSGPVFRGPAMARPATLLHRIDRILRHPVERHHASRPQQFLLAAGVAGLSLGIAGLVYRQPSLPANASSMTQWRAPQEHPNPATPLLPKPESIPRQVTAAGVAMPPSGADTRAGPQPPSKPQPTRPSSSHSVPVGTTAAQSPRPDLPNPRMAARATVRTASAVSAPRVTDRPHPPATGLAEANGNANLRASDGRVTLAPASAGPAVTATPSAPGASGTLPALAHQAGFSVPSGLDGIAGSTCTGFVAVGLRAAGGVPGRPDVVPGQTVLAHAQFFRKDSGTLWVRFNAFGRPPLDLPVRFARNGMTWTGEYGIAYTVQDVGGDRLAGLASLVANDSARLDFGCSKTASRPL